VNRAKRSSWTIVLAVLSLAACSHPIIASEYDLIVDGKLSKHGAIVGRSTRAGDGEDDKACVLNGLDKFVYASTSRLKKLSTRAIFGTSRGGRSKSRRTLSAIDTKKPI